ncbi:hypothetical protein ACJRO7_012500 [Eucalyptus globulus]|uniref:Uncharacterized protein n=1 Tax=Eucalyptus globulus TaxID=34317 RepID=A0ABD3LM93_EUCGL
MSRAEAPAKRAGRRIVEWRNEQLAARRKNEGRKEEETRRKKTTTATFLRLRFCERRRGAEAETEGGEKENCTKEI